MRSNLRKKRNPTFRKYQRGGMYRLGKLARDAASRLFVGSSPPPKINHHQIILGVTLLY